MIGGLTRFQNNGFLCPFDVMSSFGMSAAGDICLYPGNISHVTCLLSCIEYPCSSASEATVTVWLERAAGISDMDEQSE